VKLVRGILVALLVAPALVVVGATQALACSCIPPQPDRVAIRDADAVFSGRIANIESGVDIGFDNVTWTFAVDELYKGDVGETQDIRSATQGAACGVVFKEEKRYAVFAYENKGNLVTNSCMNTRPLGDDEKLELEPIAAFEPSPPPFDGDATDQWGPWAIASFGIVVLVALLTIGVFAAGKRPKTKSPGAPGTPGGPPA
jgi:hypothetical protein